MEGVVVGQWGRGGGALKFSYGFAVQGFECRKGIPKWRNISRVRQ
jgi:hypothetical protein